jgi:hypothetical protein
MNRLLAKAIGRAVKNWQAYLKSVDEAVARIREAGSPAGAFEAEVLAAQTDFVSNPSPAACRRWIECESLRQAAAVVTENVRNLVADQQRELFKTPEAKGKLRDAIEEVRAGLVAKKRAVIDADKVRAEETGVEEVSTNTLATIDLEIDRLERARGFIDVDPIQAVSALQTIING